MNDLQEQVKVEHVPAEKPEGGNGKPVSSEVVKFRISKTGQTMKSFST